jgi:CIC family chloride channel protein
MPSTPLSSIKKTIARLGFGEDWYLIILGALVGTITGLGAAGFAWALHEVVEVVHGMSDRDWSVLPVLTLFVAPIIGMTLTGVLVHNFATEAKGHGVPQVMKALVQRGGVIKLRIGIVKIVASILTVGSGGSAGTEGPIVQIGAVAGSVMGQRLRVSREHMGVLVGCGAAAGISSIFNAPIAGVFFVLEILLRDISVRVFAPIVIASVFSAVTTQALRGANDAIFPVSAALHDTQFLPVELPSYLLLGAICGLVAVSFNKMLHEGERVYDRVRLHPILKTASGGLLLGVVGVAYLLVAKPLGVSGEHATTPEFYANGYSTIELLLTPSSYYDNADTGLPIIFVLMAILVVAKMLATTLTLASGGSGGVFAPSLFLGAVTGAGVGRLLESAGLLPQGSTPASYALVGMAAVVAGTTHGVLTSILILFEMTRNIYVVLPIMLAAVVATGVAQLIERDSIYTYKLRREGLLAGLLRDSAIMRRIPISACERVALPKEPVYPSDPLSKLVSLHAYYSLPDFVVVTQEGTYMGMVAGADMRTALIDREAIPLLLVAELLRVDLPTISIDERLDTVIDKFSNHDIASLAIVDREGKPIELVTRASVLKRYRSALDQV